MYAVISLHSKSRRSYGAVVAATRLAAVAVIAAKCVSCRHHLKRAAVFLTRLLARLAQSLDLWSLVTLQLVFGLTKVTTTDTTLMAILATRYLKHSSNLFARSIFHSSVIQSSRSRQTLRTYSSRAMSQDLTTVEDIPTLVDLYEEDEIDDAAEESEFSYNEDLNRRISIWRGNIVKLKVGPITSLRLLAELILA